MENKDLFNEQNPTTAEWIAQRLKESLEQETGSVPNLASIFYGYFEKEERKPERQDPVTFAPSYLNACRRQTYYKKTGTVKSNPIDTPGYLKMHFGTIQHKELQRILKELGFLESAEEFKTIEYQGLTFIYRYDGIINYQNQRFLIEIKTIYGAGFKSVEHGPKEDHIMQAISYMVFEDLPRCIIMYIGRDNGLIRQHYLELKGQVLEVNGCKTDLYEDWYNKVIALEELKYKIGLNEIPNRDFQIQLKNLNGVIKEKFDKDTVKYKTDYQCSYCGFKDKCWKKEFNQIASHKFYINGKFD